MDPVFILPVFSLVVRSRCLTIASFTSPLVLLLTYNLCHLLFSLLYSISPPPRARRYAFPPASSNSISSPPMRLFGFCPL